MMVNLLTHGQKMMQMQQKTHELRRRKRLSPSHTKHLEYIPVKSFFHLTESCCMCESQHLQARRIQRLNSKFILVRIRNTDHVLRVRWDQNPLTEIWQWWCVVIWRGEGRGGNEREKWCYNAQWIRLEGSGYSQQQRAALTIPVANNWETTYYCRHISHFKKSPIAQRIFSYWIKPSSSWNEKQKAQWFSNSFLSLICTRVESINEPP